MGEGYRPQSFLIFNVSNTNSVFLPGNQPQQKVLGMPKPSKNAELQITQYEAQGWSVLNHHLSHGSKTKIARLQNTWTALAWSVFWGREDSPTKKNHPRDEVVYVIGVVKGTPWIRLEIFGKSPIQTSRGAVGINVIHSTEAPKK